MFNILNLACAINSTGCLNMQNFCNQDLYAITTYGSPPTITHFTTIDSGEHAQ